MAKTTDMVIFNANTQQTTNSVVKVNTKGLASTTYLSKKEYGALHGVKGQALNRAHLQYRIDRGVAANGNLAALMTSGQIVAEKKVDTTDGFKVKFTYAKNLGVAPVDPMAEASKLSIEQLLALAEAKKQAAQVPAAKQ